MLFIKQKSKTTSKVGIKNGFFDKKILPYEILIHKALFLYLFV